MKFNKRKASRAVAYLLSAVMVSQALLSPVSMVYANGDDDSSQQQAVQVENTNGNGEASNKDAAAGQGASDDTAAVTEASSTDASAKQGSSEAAASTQAAGNATTTATQAVGSASAQSSAATQNAVATQADDGYNANADPIVIDENTDPNDVTVKVGLFTDADHKNELGNTEVGANDSIYANVSMTFNKNIKPTKSSPNVEYVFPDSIKVANKSGIGVEDGKTMYTWSIQDNVFKIQFTEAFFEAHNSEIYTKADFDFKLDTSKVGEDGKLDVTFPGTGTTVTINQKEGNVSGSKTCELGSDGKTISYTVTLNPETNVTDFKLVDQLGSSLSYNNDFRLDGQDVKATVDGKTATISLDKLTQGNHTLTYTATIDQDALDNLKPGANGNNGLNSDAFKNKAKWTWSGNPEGNTSETKPDASFDLVKSKSSTDKGDGTYEWVVDLNTGTLKADMKGYTFTDKLENADALEYEGSYRVIDVTDGNKEVASDKLDSSKGSFDYTFGSDAQKHQYKIVYSTKVKDGAEYGKYYKNTATVDDHDGDKDSATGSAYYQPKGTADVKKEITQEVDADGYVNWKVTIGLSKMSVGSDITKAYFYDFTGEGYKLDKENIWFENGANLEITANGRKLVEGEDYNVYWRNSSSPWGYDSASPKAKNWGFKVVFTDKAQSLVGKTDVVVTCRTKCSKEAGTFKNTAKFNNGYDGSSEKTDQKTYEIETKDSTRKSGWLTWDQNFDWSKVDANDTTKGAWVANWQVWANYAPSEKTDNEKYGLNNTNGKPISITDDLAGMVYVPGSGSYYVKANYGNSGLNGEKCYAEGKLDDVAKIADGKLTANIPTADVFDGKGEGTHYVWTYVTYQTAIKATTEQKDLSFTNKVSSGVGSDSYGSAEATVTGKQSLVNKTAQPDQKNNLVNYTVDVNGQAQDLIPDSDVVTLTDTLTGKADLVTDSIKVTDASGASLDHSKWAYSIEQGSDASGNPTTTLKLILPDSSKLKVSYTASLNGQIGDTGTLKNNAKLGGTKSWSSAQEQNYKVAKSDVNGGGISSSISIVKKDGSSPDKSLAGAQYSLYKIANLSDLASGSKEDIENAGKFVTAKKSNEQGKIVFGGEGEQKLETATLYYFKETASPTGYIKNDTITCVVLKGNDEAKYAEVVNQLKAKGVKFETVSSFTRYNTPTSEAKAEFKARKILNGKALAKDEFTFIATDEKGKEVARGTNDADGNVTLTGDKLSWDTEGSYTYTISEVNDGKSGVTYSKDSYNAVVTVQRDGAYGPLRATVTYQNADGTPLDANALPTFTNTYKKTEVVPVSVTLSARKTVDGKKPAVGQVFQFELKDGDEVLQTKSNDGNGNIAFDAISYEGAGEHDYTISEQSKAGFKCDSKTVRVHVVVTKSNDNQLSAAVTYFDGDRGSNDPATFKNEVAPVSTKLSVKKLVNGGSEIAANNEFSFSLHEAGDKGEPKGDAIDTVAVKPGETATFGKGLSFKKAGTYRYVIVETSDLGDGWTEASPVTATVDVVAAENGALSVKSVTYSKSDTDSEGDAAALFDNTYEATGSATLAVQKTVNGKAPAADAKFDFELTPLDGAPMPDGAKSLTATTKGDKSASFADLAYTLKDAGKTYRYLIHETSEATEGWTNAGDVIAKVTVGADQGNGKLGAPTVEYVSAADEKASAANTDGTAALFDNTHAAPATAELKVSKTINGSKEDGAKEKFAFGLVAEDGAPMPASSELTVDGTGTGSFGEISYSEPGTYRYTICETSYLGAGWKNAKDVTATVTVERDGAAKTLKVSDVAYSNATEDQSAALFDNTYTAKGTKVSLEATKVLKGAELKAGHFEFQLKDAEGKVLQTAKNDKNGSVSFDPISYEASDLDGRGMSRDFEYTISEVVPDGAIDGVKDGVTYDATEHKVKVRVSDDGASGQLEAAVTYDDKSEPPVFTNTYKPKEETPHEDTPKGDTPKGGKSSGKTVLDVFGMPATGDNTMLFVTVIATAGLCALASGLRLARRKRD